MRKFGDKENQIKDSLKNMPKIKDDLDKDQLYRRVSSEMNQPDKMNKKKRFTFSPVLTAVITAGLLILSVPFFMNDTLVQDNSNQSDSHTMDRITSEESADHGEKSGSATERNGEQEENSVLTNSPDSNAVQESGNNEMIIHGAVTDLQGQYTIPLSLIVSDSTEKNQYYDEFDNYLDEENWGIAEYMFDDVTFQLYESNQHVQIDLPADFSLAEQGSAGASLFEDLLAAMFLPNQIDLVKFSESVNMGQIGMVEELSLHPTKSIYKYYQAEESDKGFLVQVPIDDQMDFETALTEMKRDEKAYHVTGTIPESAEISVQKNDSQLLFDFADSEMQDTDEKLTTMIDAILMTAKNFGYKEVTFTNAPHNHIGPYDLSAPIKVPEGANPIIPQ